MTRVIDVHAHLIAPELVKEMRRNAARYGLEVGGSEKQPNVRLDGSPHTRPVPLPLTRIDERAETMKGQGVDVQVLSSWIDFSGYTMAAGVGAAFSEVQNETIAAVVKSTPQRYVGAATVPLQDPAAAARVLERAVKDLGFRSVQIATYFDGERFLDHPSLEPFWEAAEALEVLVLIHPFDEKFPPGVKDYFLHNCIGYPLQTSIAMARMIFSGTLSRHKKLRVRFPHAGGFMPYQMERLRRVYRLRPEGKAGGLAEDPLDVLKRCYFDTVCHSPLALRYLAELVGADRLLLGSDYPFDMAEDDPVGTVKRALPAAHQPAVLGETAARLLGLQLPVTK
jgi:aminocarboxymuconate-semialdehyde decarboxylase